MLEQFYTEVRKALETTHVLVFIDDTEAQTKQRAEILFNRLDDCIQDRMNALEAVSTSDTFLCVRRLMTQMPPIKGSKNYKFILMPKE